MQYFGGRRVGVWGFKTGSMCGKIGVEVTEKTADT